MDQRTVVLSDHLCECGCGSRTWVSPKTRAERGWVKGEPRRFLVGHGSGMVSVRVLPEQQFRLVVTYRRARGAYKGRSGRPLKVVPTRVEDRGFETPCLIWLGSVDKHGYGKVSRGVGKVKAHREAFEVAFGAIPVGHDVHHRCEVKLCVEPTHLQALTPEEHGQLHGEVWRRAA